MSGRSPVSALLELLSSELCTGRSPDPSWEQAQPAGGPESGTPAPLLSWPLTMQLNRLLQVHVPFLDVSLSGPCRLLGSCACAGAPLRLAPRHSFASWVLFPLQDGRNCICATAAAQATAIHVNTAPPIPMQRRHHRPLVTPVRTCSNTLTLDPSAPTGTTRTCRCGCGAADRGVRRRGGCPPQDACARPGALPAGTSRHQPSK